MNFRMRNSVMDSMHTHTYHKDEGAKALCQGLPKQQVLDVKGPGNFFQ